jgi:hypothetical protein
MSGWGGLLFCLLDYNDSQESCNGGIRDSAVSWKEVPG